LAEQGPATKNEVKKRLEGADYKPVWTAMKSLQGRGLIKKDEDKSWRERLFPRYYLTPEGFMEALSQKVDYDALLRHARENGEDKSLEFVVDMARACGPEVVRMIVRVTRARDRGEMFTLTSMPLPCHNKVSRDMIAVLKKHPQIAEAILKGLGEFAEQFADTPSLSESVGHARRRLRRKIQHE